MPDKSLICIVDDDEEVLESLDTFFRSEGITVEKFFAAEALLAWPGLGEMDCLITDLHMPGLDGLGLGRALADRGNEAPVVVMTAFPTHAAQEAARLQSIAALVVKPIDPGLLLEKVEALLWVRGLNRKRGDVET